MSKIEKNKTLYQLLSDTLIIPDYQRDYAQGRTNDLKIEDTRINFVKDILAAANNNRATHIGLVFGSNNNGLEGFVAVDGQQRLTTCFLFHLYISKRLGDKANPELKKRLHNFGWYGRIYASEFTDFLFDINFDEDIVNTNKLSNVFKLSQDFFSIWENDPTVNNILVMLDEIHSRLKNLNGSTLKEIENNLISDSCKLNFDYMKLEDGTDEFQYQKMNSRGRDLTTYELFKQKFMSEYPVPDAIKEKMDNDWLIFFDKIATDYSSESDIFFQNYINETALWMGVKYTSDTYGYISQIEESKIKGNRTDVAFVSFDAYKEFCEHISDIENIFDWLIENYTSLDSILKSFWYSGESTRLVDIFTDADYQIRTVNYAICHYAEKTGYKPLDEINFKLWWRPIHNLIYNTEIGNRNFHNIIKSLDQIPSYNIYEYLRDKKIAAFSEYQREEERRKAIMCLSSSEMTEFFCIQEKRKRFQGQIGLLLPDDDIISPEKWKTIVEAYEYIVGEQYIRKESSDFDFITAMLTFVGNEENQNTVSDLKLKYESGHLKGGKIPARWIHQMIFSYIGCLKELEEQEQSVKEPGQILPETFYSNCREVWVSKYDSQPYEWRKQFIWIKYIIDNIVECGTLFSNSDYGKLKNKDGNLWLYRKTNKTDQDLLLSNRRNYIVDKIFGLDKAYRSGHDLTVHYDEYTYLNIVFVSDKIWIGIPAKNDIQIAEKLPDYIWSTDWYKAWTWFPGEISNNFYEHEGETLEQYIEKLSASLKDFCMKFLQDLNII